MSCSTSSSEAIKKWIIHLMNNSSLPHNQIDSSFGMEDGMDVNEYFQYEKYNFQHLSSIFDLNENFTIRILYQYQLDETRQFYFIYIINAHDKIVCKMNITLSFKNNQYYISSNDYFAQIVPKFAIWDGIIKEVGLAIKTKYPLVKIVSNDLELVSLEKSNSFDEDCFYSARFLSTTNLENSSINFSLYMQNDNKVIKEKRQVFFDSFKKELQPYVLTQNSLKLIDELYPVNVSATGKDNYNKAYPRNLELPTSLYSSFIITDSLDNDWHIN
jgi:hypothetical protein